MTDVTIICRVSKARALGLIFVHDTAIIYEIYILRKSKNSLSHEKIQYIKNRFCFYYMTRSVTNAVVENA